MAEVDGVSSKITEYLVTSLNGRILPYNEVDNVITCEFSRLEAPDDSEITPYVNVDFIEASKATEASSETLWKLIYTVSASISGINDEYVKSNKPIKEVLKNVVNYLATYCLEDRTMGGNCTKSDVVQFGEVIQDNGDGHFDFLAVILIECRLFTNSQNLFTRTG